MVPEVIREPHFGFLSRQIAFILTKMFNQRFIDVWPSSFWQVIFKIAIRHFVYQKAPKGLVNEYFMSVLNSCTVFSSKHIWDYRDNSEPVRCHETIPHKNAIFGAHLLCPRNMSWCRRSTCFWAGRHIYLERTNNSLPLLHTNLNSLFVCIWDQSISVSPSMVDPSPFQRTQLALVQDKWKCWERVEKSFSFRNWNYPTFFKKIWNLA